MAKKVLRTLSQKDIELLEWVIQEARSRWGAVPLRSTSSPYTETDADPQAPEVYVAKPQDGGSIPALVPAGSAGTGTGTGVSGEITEYDQPGMAYCDIYRITEDNDGEPALIPMNIERPVYNVATQAINPGEGYIVVKRSKQGRWLAEVSVGGGCTIVGFCCAEFDQGHSVTATVSWTTDSSVAAVGDTITVQDYCGEYFNTSGQGCGAAVLAEDGNWYDIRLTCYNFPATVCGNAATGTGTGTP